MAMGDVLSAATCIIIWKLVAWPIRIRLDL
jgi:hypothetical protein